MSGLAVGMDSRREGFGSMPLGNAWSFPSTKLTYDQTLAAMKSLAEEIAAITGNLHEWGHPIDLNLTAEPEYFKAAGELSRNMAEPIPPLCTIVTASPFDAAMHDAYGKLHRVNCFQALGPLFMRNDLAHYLGPEFQRREARPLHSSAARPAACLSITRWARRTRSRMPMSNRK